MYLLVTSSQYFWQKICYQKNWLLHFSQPQYIKFNDGSGFTFQLLLKKENILPHLVWSCSFPIKSTPSCGCLDLDWIYRASSPTFFFFTTSFSLVWYANKCPHFTNVCHFVSRQKKRGFFGPISLKRPHPSLTEVVVPYQVHSETPLIF